MGWDTDLTNRIVSYSGRVNAPSSKNTMLYLYGYTQTPRSEYYIVESYGIADLRISSDCQNRKPYGRIQSDGATYDLIQCTISIMDTHQKYAHHYYSVRNPPKAFGEVSGIITVANHLDAWEAQGERLGVHRNIMLAIEAYQGEGNADITVSDISDFTSPIASSSGGSLDYWFLTLLSGLIFVRRKPQR